MCVSFQDEVKQGTSFQWNAFSGLIGERSFESGKHVASIKGG